MLMRWDANMKAYSPYRWGYCVGILLILAGALLPFARLMDPFLAPPTLKGVVSLMTLCSGLLLAGTGILFKKTFGWYLFYMIVAVLVLIFIFAATLPFIDGSSFDHIAIVFTMTFFTLAILVSLFLIAQVRHWTRRSKRLRGLYR